MTLNNPDLERQYRDAMRQELNTQLRQYMQGTQRTDLTEAELLTKMAGGESKRNYEDHVEKLTHDELAQALVDHQLHDARRDALRDLRDDGTKTAHRLCRLRVDDKGMLISHEQLIAALDTRLTAGLYQTRQMKEGDDTWAPLRLLEVRIIWEDQAARAKDKIKNNEDLVENVEKLLLLQLQGDLPGGTTAEFVRSLRERLDAE